MERHFILPVTFAAAFHAAVLFGFRTPSVSVGKDPVRVAKIATPTPPVEVALDPPKSDPAPEDKVTPKGSSETERPTAPELLPPDPSGRIAIDLPPVTHEVTVGEKFDLKPYGVRDGSENGLDFKGAFSTRDLDNPPRTRLQNPPVYPYDAKRDNLSGTVMVEFTVDESGAVLDPHVVNSTNRIFDDATLRAVAKWRFEPGKRGGRIVRFRMAVPVVFNLNED